MKVKSHTGCLLNERADALATGGYQDDAPGLRPGPRDRRLREGLPATAVTADTAADHGGHGADHDFRGADHSDLSDMERAAGPGSAAAAADGHSRGGTSTGTRPLFCEPGLLRDCL